MAGIPENKIKELVNKIASDLPLIDKADLTVLTEIMSALSELSCMESLCVQVQKIAIRASKLAETMILEEVPFDPGCKRLNEAIGRIQYFLNRSGSEENEDVSSEKVESNSIEMTDDQDRVAVLEDALELIDKFISSQQSVLEDLEVKALNLENGSSDELSAIKRILHTMKGEFGVLNLQPYASLIHQVEASIERNEFSSENLLRLKDLLGKKLVQYADNSFPGIKEADREFVFANSNTTLKNSEDTCSKETGEITTIDSSGQINISGDPSLVADFINESREHIHNAECLLLELENDLGKGEHLNSIFRACHTIKGVAGFLGLKEIATLAHAMENLMDLARQGELKVSAVHVDLLLNAMDCLKEFIVNVETGITSGKCDIPQTYSSIMKKLQETVSTVHIETKPRKKLIGEILVEKGDINEATLQTALEKQDLGDTRKLGQILIEENNVAETKINEALSQQTGVKVSKNIEETIRVPVTRLDQLIDAIGEAVIAQSMLTADPVVRESTSQGLQTKINQANMIMRQIQQLSMSLRMVSVKSTFQKMARLVRDLSKKSGKQVDFIMEGEDTEIDKTVVEHIGDPLIHMIRNSMDHGIESPSERAAKGKIAVARIVLKAYHKAGNVFIEVKDNGRGLDKEAILNKAIERGLCKEGDKISDQEIYDFIFDPGFSTAKQITDISGRGVGMDVVKKNVDALRGSVEIQTEKDSGTTFTIRLPLTLAIIDGMIVKVCNTLYIVPTLSIVETIAAKEEIVETVLNANTMIKVRESHLPLLFLSQLFDNKINKTPNSVALIVEDTLGKRAALMVDEILGQQQVVIKNLGNGVINVPGISGGAIMSDGTVSLILDVSGIMKSIVDK